MTGPFSQQRKILQLRAAVAFPKRVHKIHIAEDHGDLLREVLPRQSCQELRPCQSPMNVRQAGVDILTELELLRAFADLNSSYFTGPFVDVLEQVTMNGLEMGKIECTVRNAL